MPQFHALVFVITSLVVLGGGNTARADSTDPEPSAGGTDESSGLTVRLGAGPISNLDDDDMDAGTGPTAIVRVGYRTRFGTEPFAGLVPLLFMPAKDTAGILPMAGVRQAIRLGRFEPYAEGALLYGGELVVLAGGGVDYSVHPDWQIGLFVDAIFTVDPAVNGQPIVMEGVQLGRTF